MMSRIKSGDLVHVPSNVMLYDLDEDSRAGPPTRYVRLERPQSLLVTKVNTSSYEVYYGEQKWLVDKNKVYEV
mgnify:FL=1